MFGLCFEAVRIRGPFAVTKPLKMSYFVRTAGVGIQRYFCAARRRFPRSHLYPGTEEPFHSELVLRSLVTVVPPLTQAEGLRSC